MFSAAQGATYGATNRRTFYSRRPRAQPMAQPIGGRFIFGAPGRNLWRNVLLSAPQGARTPRELNARADALATTGLRRKEGDGGFAMTSVMLRRVVCFPVHFWMQTDGGCRGGTMGGGMDVRVRCRGSGTTTEWRDLYHEDGGRGRTAKTTTATAAEAATAATAAAPPPATTTASSTYTAIATTPETTTTTPTWPSLSGFRTACGATPDLCSPFGLAAGPKRRAVL